MVAAPGGHIAELLALAPRLRGVGSDYLWVTWPVPQTESLLAGRRVVWTRPIEPRDVVAATREVSRAWSLLRSARPEAVVSTGSAIAVPYLVTASAFGIPAHYIEAATRTTRPSLSGRILSAVPGVSLYTQFPGAARGHWHFGGSVFDAYSPVAAQPRPIRRVVVTLGTMAEPFRRPLERLIALLPPAAEVLWQTGHTPTVGLPIEARAFVPAAELDAALRDADLVVGHCGVGTALSALAAGHVPLLLPRDPRRGEVVDSHQAELGAHLAAAGLAVVRDPSRLTLKDLQAAVALRAVSGDAPALDLAPRDARLARPAPPRAQG